ncbi:MAG: PilW family protein [Pyrinomonadaceae bacterium]
MIQKHKTGRPRELTPWSQRGFTPVELCLAVLIIGGAILTASTLVFAAFYEKRRLDHSLATLHSAQSALDLMSREISNSGFGLTDNGIVLTDSGPTSIRIRANLNRNSTIADPNEDLRFVFKTDEQKLVRFDNYPGSENARDLAGSIESLSFTYWDSMGQAIASPANYDHAHSVTIRMNVGLPEQPNHERTVIRLISRAELRNAPSY